MVSRPLDGGGDAFPGHQIVTPCTACRRGKPDVTSKGLAATAEEAVEIVHITEIRQPVTTERRIPRCRDEYPNSKSS